MIERGQEPYIADKMKNLLELQEFEVTHCVKKDTFPGTFCNAAAGRLLPPYTDFFIL
jgi:hypothetical protein